MVSPGWARRARYARAMLILVALIGCGSGEQLLDLPPTEVLAYTSTDGETWQRAPEPLVHDFQSLGLQVQPDGEIRVTGMRVGQVESWWERTFSGTRVRGYTRRDGQWEPASWVVDDPDSKAFIDPQWFGDELWYMATEGEGGDPVGPERVNRVRSSPPAATRYEGKGVADPSPVKFADHTFLFVTSWPIRVEQLEEQADGSFVLVGDWASYTVPYAVVVGDELWLYATQNVEGRRHPVRTKSRDGHTWTPFAPVVPWDSAASCTSPVMGHSGDEWLLLCVDEGNH